MSLDASELVRRARRFGLEEREAHVYLHLCRIGPSRAAEVARAAGRKRTDAYRALDALVEKGFVQRSLERPARYLPEPPEAALRSAIDARQRDLAALEAERETLAAAWPRPVAEAQQDRDRFAVLQGRAQVAGLLMRLAKEAKEEILLATSADGVGRLPAGTLFPLLEERASEGISVRVLARRTDAARQAVPPLKGVRQRWGGFTTFYHALIVDERDTVLFVSGGKGISGEQETIIWLSSSDIVVSQKALFDLAWNQAFADAGSNGHEPPHVRVVRGSWVRDARLKSMVMDATSSIYLGADAASAARWEASGLVAALKERAKAGVQVVLATPNGALDVPGSVRVAPAPAATVVAIVDNEGTLVALPSGATADHDDDWAIVSNHAAFAGLLFCALDPAAVPTAKPGGPHAPGGADAVRPSRTNHP